jgi:uncharacterized protein
MTNIIYLHGFNSAFDPENEKVKALSALGTVSGISYDSYGTYQEICTYLLEQLRDKDRDDTLIVGTSLGGFWAAEMGFKLGIPSVIINPCHTPGEMLRKYIGPQINYQTGETRNFELNSVQSYMNLKTYNSNYSFYPLVLLDMGDEVIDSYESMKLFEGFPMMCWVGGSHRFEHAEDAIEHIRQYANRCSFVEQLNI